MYLVISLFGFEGRIWDLIVSVPDHCLSFYFAFGIKGCSSKTCFISDIFRLLCIALWHYVREHTIYAVYSDFVLVFAFAFLSCKKENLL